MRLPIASLFVLLLCSTILPCLGLLPASIPISSYGTIRYDTLPRLHTEGGYIKNVHGQIVQLTGVCWMDYNIEKARIEGPLQPGATLQEQYLNTIDWRLKRHKELGINCIRVSMNQYRWYYGGDYGVTPQQYREQLDRIVQTCQDLGIYVYFCFHHGSSYHNDLQQALMDNHNADLWNTGVGWLDWVKELTARWKDYTVMIGFQIWAEPAWGNETDFNVLMQKWASFSLANAKAIHSINPDALVFVVGAGYYSHKEVPDYYANNPLPEPNIVYAWQDYYKHQSWRDFYQNYAVGNYDLAKQQMEKWFNNTAFKMIALGYPVMYAETGWNAQLNIDPEEARVIKDTADIFAKYQQGWTLWDWWGHDPPTSYDLCEGDFYSLSPYGQVAVENFASLPEPPTSS